MPERKRRVSGLRILVETKKGWTQVKQSGTSVEGEGGKEEEERERIKPRTACFEAVYRGANGIGCHDAIEPIRTRDLRVPGVRKR